MLALEGLQDRLQRVVFLYRIRTPGVSSVLINECQTTRSSQGPKLKDEPQETKPRLLRRAQNLAVVVAQ